ncbi:hypothetical protein [Hazenella coriacea]|uniref:Uncharacterized protein n=1 Tax=Hazenella coriacea TaxID=1179467 RepID=A0A4R3L599_9BACL|nr:hypothetical protein [Hazenella coriacea]TCS94971.1 hypothetical protein EDD58_103396 [Hazenella coriacea]
MSKTLNGEIIPGERIGDYYLGWSFNTLKEHLTKDFQIEDRGQKLVITDQNMKFWLDKENNSITQISVFGEFKGRFKGVIGIGSNLTDVQRRVGKWEEELDVYIMPDFPGICFELLDEEDWDEWKSPIEFISIYKD